MAAAIALPALVAMYLLKLRRRPVWVSSTMFWERSSRDLEVNVPLRWLRASWLLFLHLLVVALIIAAIGRPAVSMGAGDAARVVLVIDRSASMQATDAGNGSDGAARSRLDAAKEHARRLLRDLRRRPGGTAALVTFGARAEALAGFGDDWGMLERLIERIEPTDQPGTGAPEAMRLVASMLADEAGDESEGRAAARVALISDGDVDIAGSGTPVGGVLEFVRVGPAPNPDGTPAAVDNLGIAAIAARRLDDAPETVRLFARLRSAWHEPVTTFVSFSVDGAEVSRRAVTAPVTSEEATEGARTSGGEVSVSVDIAKPEGGVFGVRIERPDAIDADNEAAVVIEPAQMTRALLVTPSGDPERDGTWPLTDVVRELPRTTVRIVSRAAWEGAAAGGVGGLFADVVVLAGVEPRWVRAGEGVAMLTLGVDPGVPGLTAREEDGGIGRALAWAREHPVMRNVSMDAVVIGRSLVLEATPETRAAAIALAEPGAVIMAGEGAGDGSTSGTRWIAVGFGVEQTTWPLSFGWPLFVDNAIDWLTRRSERASGRVWRTGEPVEVAWGGTGETSALGPGGGAFSVRAAGGVAMLGVVERAGVYRIEGRQMSAAAPVALLDERETRAATAESVRLEVGEVRARGERERPREVWHWFVGAAALLLAIEWFVYAWRARV